MRRTRVARRHLVVARGPAVRAMRLRACNRARQESFVAAVNGSTVGPPHFGSYMLAGLHCGARGGRACLLVRLLLPIVRAGVAPRPPIVPVPAVPCIAVLVVLVVLVVPPAARACRGSWRARVLRPAGSRSHQHCLPLLAVLA